MNYDPRFAAVCGDARLPLQRTARLPQSGSDIVCVPASQHARNFGAQAAKTGGKAILGESEVARDAMETL